MCDCVAAEDATLSRHSGIAIEQLSLQNRLSTNHSGEVRLSIRVQSTHSYIRSYVVRTFCQNMLVLLFFCAAFS